MVGRLVACEDVLTLVDDYSMLGLFGLLLGDSDRQNAVLVLSLDLALVDVAHLVAAGTAYSALAANVVDVVVGLLLGGDGDVAAFELQFDVLFVKAGHFDLHYVVLVRLGNVGLHERAFLIHIKGTEKAFQCVVE